MLTAIIFLLVAIPLTWLEIRDEMRAKDQVGSSSSKLSL